MSKHDCAYAEMKSLALDRRALYRGAAAAFAVQVAGAGLMFAMQVVLARLLGAGGYGTYSLALTWATILGIIALLGHDTSVVRLVPPYLSRQAWGKLRGLRKRSAAVVLIVGASTAAAGAAVVYALQESLDRELALTLLASFVLLPILAQLRLSSAFHRALKRATSAGLFYYVIRVAAFIGLALGYATLVRTHLTAPIAMLLTAAAAAIAWACSARALSNAWPMAAKHAPALYETRSWLRLGRDLFLLSGISIVLSKVDVLILGAIRGASDVAPYFAATQIAVVGGFALQAANTITAPIIAEHYANGNHDALRRIVRDSARLTFLMTVALSLGIAILGRWLLGLFGPSFQIAYVPLLVVLLGQCINAAAGPVGYLLTMTRFERQALTIFGGSALLNIILGILLVPEFGMLGAAVGATTATVVWNVVALVLVHVRLQINPTVLPLSTR